MAYVPDDARWYLADLVMEHQIEDEPRNVVHVNTILVRANSPERAYRNALRFGKEAEFEFKNTTDKTVRVVFRGLRDLKVIYEPLRSGSELFYEERIGLSEEEVAKLVSPKDELGVFEAIRKPSKDKPDYMPGDIMAAMKEMGFTDDDLYA